MKHLLLPLLLLLSIHAFGQRSTIYGKVTAAEEGKPLQDATVFLQGTSRVAFTDALGRYRFEPPLQPGTYEVAAFVMGRQSIIELVTLGEEDKELNFALSELKQTLEEVTVYQAKENTYGITRLKPVEGMGIYEAKKSEVIVVEDLNANLATNNPRQAYAKVPGLLIWESDGAGLQLGIGARGLSPNRTSNFNVRQNGIDISADPLGYPESYYTPPLEALQRIEVVRGAASLQYGTQFGGMLNFVMKSSPRNTPFEFTTRNTLGSFGLFNTFNSVGGTTGKVNYFSFFQHKQGNGWRPNSEFDNQTAYGSVSYELNDRLTLGAQYTYMHYLAQQPGGLTDVQFEADPQQSFRARNWFQVDWNLAAITVDYRFSDRTRLNSRNFFLYSGRQALGNLERINRTDLGQNRTLLKDRYRNFGNETRLLHHYSLGGHSSVLLTGIRYYRGFTTRQQGDGNDASGPDFYFLNPDSLENSDFDFPSENVALFVENIFNLSDRFSITPGLRFEHISTDSEGYFTFLLRDRAGNVLEREEIPEERNKQRAFLLAGLGLKYQVLPVAELYANFSQNYRSITFSDLRVTNPNIAVDPGLDDERGYNADIGFRGGKEGFYNFDVSLFYLRYNDRIGFVNRVDTLTGQDQRFRTNVGNAYSTGLELFGEVDVLHWLSGAEGKHKLNLFVNTALLEAKYLETNFRNEENQQVDDFEGNDLELVAPITLRTGLTYRKGNFSGSVQYSYTEEHFTDASNTRFTPNAVSGIIPAYSVVDLSLSYEWKIVTLEGGINNLTDERYFTRRADGYPGPGIIPADARSYYVTVGISLR